MRNAFLAALVTIGGGALLHAAPALAHIDLLEPEARAHGTAASGDTDIDDNSSIKNGPCGQVTTGRTDRVARYAPGQTIRVRVREENAHESYLRVALDLDGNEFPLRAQFPGGAETQAEASAAEDALDTEWLLLVYREDNDTAGFVHELDVTLPERSCTGCTLQVLQYMYDDPGAPYYFQCADLVIADDAAPDAGALPVDGGDDPTSAPPATTGGSDGAEGGDSPGEGSTAPTAPGSVAGAAGAGGSAGAGNAGGAAAAPSVPVAASSDGEGCSVSGAPRAGTVGLGVVMLGLTLLGLGSRRRSY
jgi:MYXO-CTERM domain-containing protein